MMEYRQLGRTGVRVSPLCLGTMNFGKSTDGANDAEDVATIHAALEAGINFVDTANIYSQGRSEEIVGRALQGRREAVVLATKVYNRMGEGPNEWGSSRRHIIQQCEASLRRLHTDWIDLYQLHRPDPTTPIEETLLALEDLIRAGKVRYVGVSTFPAWETMEAIAVADACHLAARPVSEQPPYNLLDRRVEAEVVPLALKHGLGLLPWAPLSSGILTGKYQDAIPSGSRLAEVSWWLDEARIDRARAAVGALARLAADASLTLIQLALAWLIQQPSVAAPIVGPRDRAQLADHLAGADITLAPEILAAVDRIVPPTLAVYPVRTGTRVDEIARSAPWPLAAARR